MKDGAKEVRKMPKKKKNYCVLGFMSKKKKENERTPSIVFRFSFNSSYDDLDQ